MKNWILFLFLFLIGVQAYSGDYYFYYQGKKIQMNRDYSCLTVKFEPGLSSSKFNRIIEQSAGSSVEKKSEFTPGSSRSGFVIVRLKQDLSGNSVSGIRAKLVSARGVESVGMCFPGRGKMKHYTTDEIIVKFKKNVSSDRIENVNRFFGTTIIEKVENFDNVYLVAVNSKGDEGSDNVFDVSNKYVLLGDIVDFAQPNFIREGMLLSNDFTGKQVPESSPPPPPLPNDPYVPSMWHVKNTGNNIPDGVIGIPGCDMNMDSAWAITTGDPNVLISIVDTGIDTNQVDLRGNLCDRSLWYDAVDNNQRPYDQYYHGTGVSGCSSAIGNNDTGTVGIAYTCKIIPVRVFGPYPNAFTTDLILSKGLNWAWLHGAGVISCSWGGGIPTPLIADAIQNAVHYGRGGRGTMVFAGAGNDNIDTLLYPASMPEVIGVGGLSPCNERKSLTSCDIVGGQNQQWGASYGQGLSLVAPCTYIGTTELLGGFCVCGNGTSCSSPLAAGVGALIISKNGNISGDSARMIIERTAKKVGNYSYNVSMPNGLWNNEMGYGRIDTKAALDMTPAGPPTGNDLISPVITIYPPESGVFNSNVSVNAKITDNTGVSSGSNLPRLYYYTSQNNQLQAINGLLTSPNMYRFTFPQIPFSMSLYYYIAAQDDNANAVTYPLGGKGSNPPGTARPPKFMFLRNTTIYDTGFTATDVPINIIAPRETTYVSLLHNPVNKTVLDVDCWFNINHNFDGDLSVSLVSPQGTEVVLAGGIGDSSQNFVNTYFDDEAAVAIDSLGVRAPFTGRFKPLQKLWFFDGESSGGDWKLKVLDNGRGDVGQLVSWGMKITYSSSTDYIQFPVNFALVRNYPNPFNPQTRILFNAPYTAQIKILLYDIMGRKVATILNERRGPALEDYVDFNINSVTNVSGSGMASGVYFYSLLADDKFIQSKKMVLVK